MKKTDTQIHRDVVDELAWDPKVKEAEIAVAVKGGVVTLTGSIDTYAQKYAAERAAERVSGVQAIADDLHVRIPGTLQRTDTEIAHTAVSALSWDIEVPDGIKVKVDNGYVTLDGKVDWQYQKSAAERDVRYLTGIKGVMNKISVSPRPSAFEVRAKIEKALKRSAEIDAQHISVEAADGKVILKGKVRSWAERQDAEHAAWAAPGVTQVDDRLVITS
jgi:osmotically-inducible protein OsmY